MSVSERGAPAREGARAVNIRVCLAIGIVALLAACATQKAPEPAPAAPVPITPSQDVPSSPVVREALPAQPVPPTQEGGPTPPAMPSIASIPPRTLYVCSKLVKGEISQTAIEFIPKVDSLCRRHPEMLPCQYERDICRRGG